jgi:DeoR/GlpR family transcriptional regulator of sugar metabolism
VTPEGFSTASLEEAAIYRRVLAAAGRTYVLADHTKFARLSLVLAAPLDGVAGVVVDAETPADRLAWLHGARLQVIVAEPAQSNDLVEADARSNPTIP